MGIETAVGNFFFRSRFSAWLYNVSTASPWYIIRLVGAVFISLLLVARAGRLFIYTKLTKTPVLGFAVVGTVWGGPVKTAAAGLIVGVGYLFWQQLKQPAINKGHRAGGKGFSGPHPENTLEALQNLIQADGKQPMRNLHYVEFDVHETKDGELVILHDLPSLLAASREAEINRQAVQELSDCSIDLSSAKAKDLTLKQLKAIHVGGNKGIKVPTLSEFLRCCEENALQRSIAAEVKSIITDRGREQFLEQLRSYKNGYCSTLEKRCGSKKYEPFGWVAAIAFPFLWAASFGEFCSPEWAEWGGRFRAAGIPVKSCVLHSLDLVPPLR